MSAVKEKVSGLKLIFSDSSTKFLSISTFVFLLLLISAKYIQNNTYALVVGSVGMIFFGFLFTSWIVFGVRRMSPLPNKKGENSSRKGLRTTYVIAVVFTFLGFVGLSIFYLLFLFVIINIACYAWAFIENVYLAKSIYGISSRVAKSRRGLKMALHFVIAGVYTVYLVYKVISSFNATPSPSGTLPFAIDQNVLDWALSLLMFLYAFAGMGEKFLQPLSQTPSDAETPAHPGRKEAFLIISILFLTLGFHLFVDGLPAMIASLFSMESQTGWLFDVQEGLYSIFRLTCFLPIIFIRPFQGRKDQVR